MNAAGMPIGDVSTHSHPKVAAKSYCRILDGDKVSTHSHPKVAACLVYLLHHYILFQHTATRRWLQLIVSSPVPYLRFQHTATRRWLQANELASLASVEFQHTATRRWLHLQGLIWL